MALKLLLNAGLIAIPIGGSLGALFGIDAHRSATGQRPLFTGDSGSNGGAGGSPEIGTGSNQTTSHNGVTTAVYCKDSYGIPVPSNGQQFTLNPNQWGVTASTVGALCLSVKLFENMTYPTKYTAPQFSTTWQYDPGPADQPTHAYPNIMVDGVLPVQLDKMTSVNLDFSWTYGIGDTIAQTTSVTDLDAHAVNTNVAIDMFFDTDSTKAQDSGEAKYEVMVWFAQIGTSSKAIGNPTGAQRTINGTTFTLWSGTTRGGTLNTLTWIANELTETFVGDIYPLITDLYSMGGDVYPSSNDYMGIFQLGTEAYSSDTNVTFSVSSLSIDIQKWTTSHV